MMGTILHVYASIYWKSVGLERWGTHRRREKQPVQAQEQKQKRQKHQGHIKSSNPQIIEVQ